MSGNWRTRRVRRKLRTKANQLARDAQMFATGTEFDLPMVQDAEKLTRSALSVLRFAAQLDALKESEEDHEDSD